MTVLHLIVARARNGVIGKDGKLPWHLPEDLKHFKEVTLGKPVIMGRKTWESLPKALPGRLNVVITRQADYVAEGATVVSSVEQAIDAVKDYPVAFIIGGAQLYAQTMNRVNVAHITVINADTEGDAFFEGFNEDDWTLTEKENYQAAGQNPSFSIRCYKRKEKKKVWLTVEEAKQLKMFLDDAVELHDKGVVVIQSTGFDTIQMFKERIKQAEKS